MHKTTKKWLSIILSVSIMFSLCGISALAEEENTDTAQEIIETVQEQEEISDIENDGISAEEIAIEETDEIAETENLERDGTSEIQLMSANVTLMSSSDIMYYEEYGIYFNKANGSITKCDNSLYDYTIPECIDGVTVVSIENSAFYDCTKMTSIKLPNTIIWKTLI